MYVSVSDHWSRSVHFIYCGTLLRGTERSYFVCRFFFFFCGRRKGSKVVALIVVVVVVAFRGDVRSFCFYSCCFCCF